MPIASPWIFPDWPAPRSVRAAVTTRAGPGVSRAPFGRFNLGLRSGDEATAVASNRRALRQALDLPSDPRWLHQVHGTEVAELGPLATSREPVADAAVSRIPGTVLAILSADCLAVLLCADDGGEIAAAHAGWRGLAAGVLEATVAAMATPPARLIAWLGPSIGAANYEVGVSVYEAFGGAEAPAGALTPTRPAHWRCDLAHLARDRLTQAGVGAIHDGSIDTFTDRRLYSYRREGPHSGRFATLIWTAA
jgi:YfiH family protein